MLVGGDVWTHKGEITKERVATAFLHSHSTKKVHFRSALSSWALTSSLPFHTYEERPVVLPNYSSCGNCNFNKLMSNKEYVNEDLNVLDLAIFHKMLETVQNYDAQRGARQLEKRWKGVFPSSKNERDVVMEVWGYAGLLVPQETPRRRRNGNHDFNSVAAWQGDDGYSQEALGHFFGTFL
ncbi:UNVERIFIED_CONTAM: hypothetical protein ABIC26_003669 [Paenibacillus sp. PvR008]